MRANRLIVTKNEKRLYQKELKLEQVNWVGGRKPELPLNIKARIRYRHEAVPAQILEKSNKYILEFKTKQRAITPGQSAVFYKRGEVLGGGVIS
jgi:tRNA-specific 2-thiouridylase